MFTARFAEWLHAAALTAGSLTGTSSWYELATAQAEPARKHRPGNK